MNRKPKLTVKVVRGLLAISHYAGADLEAAETDEIPPPREETEAAWLALAWIRRIANYYRDRGLL